MIKTVFLSPRGSARAPIALGIAIQKYPNTFQSQAAGLKPGVIHPQAVAILKEHQIHVDQLVVQSFDSIDWQQVALVVVLCGRDISPKGFPNLRVAHWPLPDPAELSPGEYQIKEQFRDTFEAIESHLNQLAKQLEGFDEDG